MILPVSGLPDQKPRVGRDWVWSIKQDQARAGFRRDFALTSPNADLNAQITSAILGCFPPELFDSTGLAQTLWMSRLTSAATDVQGLIAELFSVPRESPAGAAGCVILARRHQR